MSEINYRINTIFKARDGELVNTVSLFANSWKVDGNCLDATEASYCSIKNEAAAQKDS